MEEKIKILLDKINIDENSYQYFNDARITKIKVNPKNKSWNIFIDKDNLLPVEVYKELEEKKYNLDENANNIEIIYNIKNIDVNGYLDYYKYLLETLKEDLRVLEIYEDCMKIENDFLILVVSNEIEKEKLEKTLPKIINFYKKIGYNFNIELELRHENNILEEIRTELDSAEIPEIPKEKDNEVKKETTEKKQFRREPKDENSIMGRGIKEPPIKIKTIVGEDNNIVVEAKVFGVELFESSKNDFKIITLKITDYSDSMYCKVFVRDEEEYKNLCKELKEGKWFKIRGYTKNDQFAKELVLFARDILKIEKTEETIKDTSEEKRVELHCHTKMSQMDGVADETDIVKTAMKFGMHAVAITDHNGVQGFPHVFSMVTEHNKNLKEGEEPFKAIYGAELTMIDDAVDIVVRPNDSVMLEDEFVVFDFETTGFNAGGADSIIEIGAVKIKDGMITDRYDELINPGRPLPVKITELTNITDTMLEGKDNEENAVKRFIEWFGDCPMVAHNAKFDMGVIWDACSFYHHKIPHYEYFCSLQISKKVWPEFEKHALTFLGEKFSIKYLAHEALEDAKTCGLVVKLAAEKVKAGSVEELLKKCGLKMEKL